MSNPRVFQRSVPAGVIGLAHVVLGFLGIIWAIVRISLFGPGQAFSGGFFTGLFSYLYELPPFLLWASGIGLLRARPWGRRLALGWAGALWFLELGAYAIRLATIGDLAPEIGWGTSVALFYALLLAGAIARREIIAAIAPLVGRLGLTLPRPGRKDREATT